MKIVIVFLATIIFAMSQEQQPRRHRTSAGLPDPHNIDRLPPHDIEAEQGCLGCVLLDPPVVMPDLIRKFAGYDEVFYDLRHQVIFQHMLELWNENVPIDVILLSERLRRSNQLESVGGLQYLTALPDAVPSAANAAFYADIIIEKTSLRRMIIACTAAVGRIYEADGTPEELLSRAERDVMAARGRPVQPERPITELIHSAIGIIEHHHQNPGVTTGISTGFVDLDRMTNGLQGGKMTILSGFTSTGKSTLALNICENVAVDQNIPVAYFSLEMGDVALALRMLCSRARVNMRNVRDGFFAERDFPRLTGAAGRISRSPIHIIETTGKTAQQIRAESLRLHREHGIRLIVVDYLQLLLADSALKGRSRQQELAHSSIVLYSIAKQLDIPIIVLSQLNKEGDTRESKDPENDCDLHLKLKYPEREDGEEGVDPYPDVCAVDLEITKQRDGPRGVIHMTLFKSFTRFELAARVGDMPADIQGEFI